jgi:hypothetical protein
MPKATQLVLAHENRPGLLAQIGQVLGDAKVNILACLTTTSASEGLTRLILDNPDGAKKAFVRAGLRFREEDVLQIELPNEPGALAKYAAKLVDKDIKHHPGLRYRRKRLQEDECGSCRFRSGQGNDHSIATGLAERWEMLWGPNY